MIGKFGAHISSLYCVDDTLRKLRTLVELENVPGSHVGNFFWFNFRNLNKVRSQTRKGVYVCGLTDLISNSLIVSTRELYLLPLQQES